MAKTEPPIDFELRWARAVKRDRENNLYLNDIAALFRENFLSISPLDEVSISGVDEGVGVTIFFKKDADIAECEANGITQKMQNFVYDNLEKFGRGKRDEIRVSFVFDSFENVEKNYDGNYFLRMR